MKKIIAITIIAFLTTSLVFVSCKKNEGNNIIQDASKDFNLSSSSSLQLNKKNSIIVNSKEELYIVLSELKSKVHPKKTRTNIPSLLDACINYLVSLGTADISFCLEWANMAGDLGGDSGNSGPGTGTGHGPTNNSGTNSTYGNATISSFASGNTFGWTWTQGATTTHISQYGIVTKTVWGTFNYNIIFEGIGTIFQDKVGFVFKIDPITKTWVLEKVIP